VDLVKTLLAGIAGGVVTIIISLLVARAKSQPDTRGWRRLKPSAMHWTGIGLGSGLCLLMVYVRLFVGSSRADANTQMTILTWLIIVFGLLTIATAIAIHAIWRRDVRWRGRSVSYTRRSRTESRNFDEVEQVRINLLGQAVLVFADGSLLRIDPHASGASELLERLEERHANSSKSTASD
jgi:small-conductance mechanosensitive channel